MLLPDFLRMMLVDQDDLLNDDIQPLPYEANTEDKERFYGSLPITHKALKHEQEDGKVKLELFLSPAATELWDGIKDDFAGRWNTTDAKFIKGMDLDTSQTDTIPDESAEHQKKMAELDDQIVVEDAEYKVEAARKEELRASIAKKIADKIASDEAEAEVQAIEAGQE